MSQTLRQQRSASLWGLARAPPAWDGAASSLGDQPEIGSAMTATIEKAEVACPSQPLLDNMEFSDCLE